MASIEITALLRITDGGHNIAKGKTEAVEKAYADEWTARGWAELVKPKAAK